MNRVAGALKDNDTHYHEFREIMLNMRFGAGGRVQAAMGTGRLNTAYNCFVSGEVADSFVDDDGSIMQRAAEAAKIMRMGGGIGYNFSTLRPHGALIKKLGSHSDGPIPFIRIFDAVGRATSATGYRKGGQMAVLDISHPDVFEFIHAKQNQEEFKRFNFSIGVSDEFMEAKAAGKPFKLRFGGEVYREIDPADLWDQLMRSTWDWGEPGVLFLDTINRMNPLYYCETIRATNPCVGPECPILTQEHGWIDIGSIVGKQVSIWNGKAWSQVIPRKTGENQDMLKITLSDGSSLRCTKGHKFIQKDGVRIDASQLTIGTVLQSCKWPLICTGSNFKLAYHQGFFSGDGWSDARGRDYVGLYGEKQKLRHLFEPHAQTTHEYDVDDSGWGHNYEKKLYCYMGKNAMKPRSFVPETDWSVQSRLDWLAGLIDSDGTVCVDGSVQITAKDRNFLERVELLLRTLGESGNLKSMKDCWRTNISASKIIRLKALGLQTHRVDLSYVPQRECKRALTVTAIAASGSEPEVFCFTESREHKGCFNGVLTGQCGEQPLPPFGACLLGSFILPKYIHEDFNGHFVFNWEQLQGDIEVVVRAMDNVIDRTQYPLIEQKQEALSKRRMGLGVTGLANAGEALGWAYGSPKFIEFEETVLDIIRDYSYAASAKLAKEKGIFPKYDPTLYQAGEFFKTLSPWVQDLIKQNGLRNSHLTSIAPTGTMSFAMDNVSSSIEPVFSYDQERDIVYPDGTRTELIQDYGIRVFGVKGKRCADVTIGEHLAVLAAAAKRVDSAVSKTCNVPPHLPWEDFKQVYDRAWELGCKGVTTFNPDGKRFAVLRSNDVREPEETGVDVPDAMVGMSCAWDPVSGRRSCE
jgi:ribonucleoside-diphosphate reductase alpha chain